MTLFKKVYINHQITLKQIRKLQNGKRNCNNLYKDYVNNLNVKFEMLEHNTTVTLMKLMYFIMHKQASNKNNMRMSIPEMQEKCYNQRIHDPAL